MIEMMSTHPQSNPTPSTRGGGPMMNASNGRHSTVTTPDNSITLNNNSDYQPFPMTSSDVGGYDSEFFSGSNEYLDERSSWSDRPESRHSLNSSASPLNQLCHVSPAQNTPSTPFTSLPFSPVDEKKDSDMIIADVNTPNEIGESARLRNLLTNKKSSIDEDTSRSRQILESRLNQEENIMEISNDSGSNSGLKKTATPTPMSESSYTSSSQNNTMLLKVRKAILFTNL